MNKKTILSILVGLFALMACSKQTAVKEIVLSDNWYVCSSDSLNMDGTALSSGIKPGNNLIKTTVPSTVLGILCNAGVYKDPFYAMNLENIPVEPFKVSWWYMTTFNLPGFNSDNEQTMLYLDGINYRANIWLNGKQVLSADSATGAFRQFICDITPFAYAKSNSLAIEVIPPEAGDFYMGFVDWAPVPPDNNMGVFRPVRIKRSGKVSLSHPFVKTDVDVNTLKKALLTIQTNITNHSKELKNITLEARIDSISVRNSYSLKGGQIISAILPPDKYDELIVHNPRLWWPNGLGEPTMHTLKLMLYEECELLDSVSVRFGIRSIDTYLNKTGARGYKVNGRELLIKSAGWVDDLFLRNSPAYNKAQIRYVKEMNLNSLRLEGFWGTSQELYDLCDDSGILVMVGWSCQWEWPDYLGLKLEVPKEDQNIPINEGVDKYGVKLTPEEENLIAAMFKDQVLWLRNHPSVFVWAVGSDAMPKPSLEEKYNKILDAYDDTRSLLVSAGEFESEISGRTGMKMNGPYEYVPPVYWFEDKKLGGAFGFNTETGPGPQIPPIESIRKMIPDDSLWPPLNEMWNFHSGRKDFNSVKVYLDALYKRYGKPHDIEELAMKAQWMNYESIRPMFEAFVINRPIATGVVQWQLNSAWPEFYWQLYDWYLMPTGAYFGTKKACQPVNIMYNYYDRKIYVSNDALGNLECLSAAVTLFDSHSKQIYQTNKIVDLAENTSKEVTTLPDLKDRNEVYFLKLTLYDHTAKVISDNFYWLSGKKDEMDWNQYFWYYTPQKQFANLSRLNDLPSAQVCLSKNVKKINGEWVIELVLCNTSPYIAFGIELLLTDQLTKKAILPVFWEDNYISLIGKETRTIQVRCMESDAGSEPVVVVQGVNIESIKQ